MIAKITRSFSLVSISPLLPLPSIGILSYDEDDPFFLEKKRPFFKFGPVPSSIIAWQAPLNVFSGSVVFRVASLGIRVEEVSSKAHWFFKSYLPYYLFAACPPSNNPIPDQNTLYPVLPALIPLPVRIMSRLCVDDAFAPSSEVQSDPMALPFPVSPLPLPR